MKNQMEDFAYDEIDMPETFLTTPEQLRLHIQSDPLLSGLSRENFDSASYLYDLYRTRTITEMNEFKWKLQEAQNGAEATMRALIEDSSEGFNQACRDVLLVREALNQVSEPLQHFNKLKDSFLTKFSLEKNVVDQIKKSQIELQKLNNVLSTDILIKNIQQVFSSIQKIGFSYDFQEKRILDPLGLSVTLKAFILDSTASNPNQATANEKGQKQNAQGNISNGISDQLSQIPEVKEHFKKLIDIIIEYQ